MRTYLRFILVFVICGVSVAWLDWQTSAIIKPSARVVRETPLACDAGGDMTPVADYLLANVSITDRLATRGDLRGHRVDMAKLEAAANEYARMQVAPGVILATLEHCLPDAKRRYAVGYAIIMNALYREAQRRPPL